MPAEHEKNSRKLLILHGNCQLYQVAAMLQLVPTLRKKMRVIYVAYDAELTFEQQSRCAVYVYQPLLGEKWGSQTSACVIEKLLAVSPGISIISVPSIIFLGYWPFHDRNSAIACNNGNFGDFVLDELAQSTASTEKIIDIYAKIVANTDLKKIVDETIATQEEKEKPLTIKSTHLYKDKFRDRLSFHSFIHPVKEILVVLANECLALLDCPPVSDRVFQGFIDSTALQEIPIAPSVAKRLSLRFYKEDMRFKTYGSLMTYREYIECYVSCARIHADLTEYLLAVHEYKKNNGLENYTTQLYAAENARVYKFAF